MSDLKYPECERLKEVSEKSQSIGEFLHWVFDEKNLLLAEWRTNDYAEDTLFPFHHNIEKLLAEFFKIDLDKAEEERCQMIEEMRKESP